MPAVSAEVLVPPPAAAPEPIVVSQPERVFASRMPAAEPARPLPSARRGIFFDVENSSRPEHVAAVLDHLQIDRGSRLTDLVAMGNWKVASGETARLLAQRGAQLVHSAPSTGVKDWSDLRIAVAAGVWLAAARPGDVVEIITDDQAFDAVGDVAAGLGVTFHRLSFRALAGMGLLPTAAAPREESRGARGGRGRGRGRGRRGRGGRVEGRPDLRPAAAPAPAHRPAAHHAPAHHAAAPAGAHTAPAEQIRAVVDELLQTSPIGVTLDALSNALKSKGFRRPPGSPRLITRLRNLKGIEVTRTGIVRLLESGGAERAQPAEAPVAESPPVRGVSQLAGMPEVIASNFDAFAGAREDEGDEVESDGPGPGNEAEPTAAVPSGQAGQGRRRRRGGRRRRGRRGRGGPGGGVSVPGGVEPEASGVRDESS